MPDGNKWTEEERDKASAFINEKAQREGDPCPHCGNLDTSVAENVFRLSVGTAVVGPGFVPIMPVICNNCGHVRIFSAIALGIFPSPNATEGEG